MTAKATDSSDGRFSAEERAAMKERAAELKKEAGRGKDKQAAAELDVLAKIQAMPAADRALAERIHTLVTTHAPDLAPRLWYGQPAYARKGKVVCFFRSGAADGERYSTFSFTAQASLDDASGLWPTSYAVTDLSERAERAIVALLKKATG